MSDEKITFSFGQSWSGYVATVAAQEIDAARKDLEYWLGPDGIKGHTILDIGSGSGIHSLSFLAMKAHSICSFDADSFSVQVTRSLWQKAGQPKNWSVSEGSILDGTFLRTLRLFDLVYSWGVLHHTGAMWEALEKASALVKPGGKLFISLYTSGPRYQTDLALKRRYNAASTAGKRLMEYRWIANLMLGWLLQGPIHLHGMKSECVV